jgi:iron(III) transport system substrate-binding protein
MARRRPRRPARIAAALTATVLAGTLASCGLVGSSDEDVLLIYSGRNEELVSPLIEQLEEQVDIPVEVRYGDSSELSAQLLEEGEGTEADLFFSQDAGALGALAKDNRLEQLPATLTEAVPEQYVDDQGRWVAASARARVLVYHPDQIDALGDGMPAIDSIDSVDDILVPELRGEIGFAPTNASFQAFVTALRVSRGEQGARQWLEDFAALDPEVYENNIAVLEAVDAGEASLGLINHYYWFERVEELGRDQVSSRLHFLDSGDAGALVNVAGVGVINDTNHRDSAMQAVEFLLSEQAQEYFATETFEYPVVDGIPAAEGLPALDDLRTTNIDLNELDSLEQTLALLDDVGLT